MLEMSARKLAVCIVIFHVFVRSFFSIVPEYNRFLSHLTGLPVIHHPIIRSHATSETQIIIEYINLIKQAPAWWGPLNLLRSRKQ